jgi:hypothetical protein
MGDTAGLGGMSSSRFRLLAAFCDAAAAAAATAIAALWAATPTLGNGIPTFAGIICIPGIIPPIHSSLHTPINNNKNEHSLVGLVWFGLVNVCMMRMACVLALPEARGSCGMVGCLAGAALAAAIAALAAACAAAITLSSLS